jgi:hypothetical protein
VRQVLYTVRSERLLIEQLDCNRLFRWFVGLSMDAAVWHPTTFTKNRDRLRAGEIAARFFDAVTAQARAVGLLSNEHFTVDGRRTPPRRTRRPSSTRRGMAKRRVCRTWGMCCSTTGNDWSRMSAPPPRRAPPNATRRCAWRA